MIVMISFRRHPRYNLPPERLRVIEKYVQQRAQLLLETMQLPDDEQEL